MSLSQLVFLALPRKIPVMINSSVIDVLNAEKYSDQLLRLLLLLHPQHWFTVRTLMPFMKIEGSSPDLPVEQVRQCLDELVSSGYVNRKSNRLYQLNHTADVVTLRMTEFAGHFFDTANVRLLQQSVGCLVQPVTPANSGFTAYGLETGLVSLYHATLNADGNVVAESPVMLECDFTSVRDSLMCFTEDWC